MITYINSPFSIGALKFSHRLIQGPLAGYSCAPFRELFSLYQTPAYCVTEMISSMDAVLKRPQGSRYLYRSPKEELLAYQISGNDPLIVTQAAHQLSHLGADLIDINCGCPKLKIRKKGAGSALLETPSLLLEIVTGVRKAITCPLTIKLRLQQKESDLILAKQLEDAGADALIIHGRRWIDDYDIACNLAAIAEIKRAVTIPVIANGDIADQRSLESTFQQTGCDAFMIARAGTGKPWLYKTLLRNEAETIRYAEKVQLFITHLEGLARLESDFKAVLQSKSLVRYYFKEELTALGLKQFYTLTSISQIYYFLINLKRADF